MKVVQFGTQPASARDVTPATFDEHLPERPTELTAPALERSNTAPGAAPTEPQPDPKAAGKIRRRRPRHATPTAVLARAVGAPANADPVQVLADAVRRRRPAAGAAGQDRQAVSQTAPQATFWDVWLAHRNDLRRQSLRFAGGNPAEAEDALSEAMLKAAEAFSTGAIREHRAWLLRLVHNTCMDRHRSWRRQNGLSGIVYDGAPSAPAVVPAPSRSPEEHLTGEQLIGSLQRAIRALPRSLAEPLLLYLDDVSDAEIARRLSVTLEVVRKRRQLARDRLRVHLTL